MGLYLETLLLGFAILASVVIIIIISHQRRNKNSIITEWPVVGMLPGLLQNFYRLHDFATDVLIKSGGTFEFKGPRVLPSDFIITSDPLNIQYILATKPAEYLKAPALKELFDVLGDGIMNAESDLWKLQRKMFHLWIRRSNAMFDSFIARVMERQVVDALIPFLDHASENKIQVDLQDAFKQLITFDNSMQLIFGLDPSSCVFDLPKSEYQRALEYMEMVILRRHVLPMSLWKFQRWLQIGAERKFTRARSVFDKFMYQCLSLKKQIKEKEESPDLGMLNVYLEEKGNTYTEKFLRDVATNFFVTGKDTLSSSLGWFFWLVATHPSAEAKIIEEMKENNLFRRNSTSQDNINRSGFCTGESLNKLVYLKAALHEALRLFPVIPYNLRMSLEDDTLPSGHCVKKNDRIFVSYYAMARMEEIWGRDCLEYKPERWISESGEFLHVLSHKFSVFGAGPRLCPGKEIVLVQMKVMAIWLLGNFSFEVVEGHLVSPNLAITLHIKHGLKVRVSKRCI